jgi:hypothetical protein
MASGSDRWRGPARWLAYCIAGLAAAANPAWAGTFSAKDAAIIAKAMGFLDPAPPGGVLAVLYSDAASKADADAVAALFQGGLSSTGGSITAKAVDAAGLGDGSGFVGVIVASGAATPGAMAAAKAHHIPCITADPSLVQSGACVMTVASDPKVDITVSRAAATSAGVNFSSAFAMLIHEI